MLTLPRVADSVAGRMETIHMLPLAHIEVLGEPLSFLEHLFDGRLQEDTHAIVGDDLIRERIKAKRSEFGAVLESFVFGEIMKLLTGSDMHVAPYHFRDQHMREVDLVLERDDGTIAGIEVKASATVKTSDFAGLRALAEACQEQFAFGVVLYDSGDRIPFGEKLAAAPLSCLWN